MRIQNVPLLEKLTISDKDKWSHPPTNLNETFFRAAPRLTYIQLTWARLIPKFPPLISPLTHRHINSCGGWRSTDEIVIMLAGLLRLQSFKWKRDTHSAARMRPRAQLSQQRLDMTSLVQLEMADTRTIITDLMSRISPSLTCDMILSLDINDSPAEVEVDRLLSALDSGILPHLTAVFAHHSNRGFTDLQIVDDCENYGLTARWSKPCLLELPGPSKFELCILGADDLVEQQGQALSHILGEWPGTAAHVNHHTVFRDDPCEDEGTGRTLFGHLERTVYLTTGGAASGTLYTVLYKAEESHLPCLTKLTLRDVGLTTCEYHGYIDKMEGKTKGTGFKRFEALVATHEFSQHQEREMIDA